MVCRAIDCANNSLERLKMGLVRITNIFQKMNLDEMQNKKAIHGQIEG